MVAIKNLNLTDICFKGRKNQNIKQIKVKRQTP